MITFSSIKDEIQKTMFEKMDMLDRNVNYSIGSTRANDKGVDKNYMFTRSTWLRMVSLSPGKVAPGSPVDKSPVVLMGGEADSNGNLVSNLWGSVSTKHHDAVVDEQAHGAASNINNGQTISGLNTFGLGGGGVDILEPAYDEEVRKHGRYYVNGTLMPFRPMAGIKDVSVEYKGGGMKLGATRTATVSWTCWTWEDLDRFMPHFLHHGKSVFVDWGWSGIGALKDVQPYTLFKDDSLDFDLDKIKNLANKIPEYILSQKGNYDAMLAKVQNFEWTVRDDGGFDCTTTLISQGASTFQQTLKTSGTDQAAGLPLLGLQKRSGMTSLIKTDHPLEGESWNEETLKTIEKYNKYAGADDTPHTGFTDTPGRFQAPYGAVSELAPYFTFSSYMADFKNQLRWSIDPWEDREGVKISGNANVISSGQVIKIKTIYSDPSGFGEDERSKFFFDVIGKTYFVTWGWFEDNVLSRFFGRIGKNESLIGEVRSIEKYIDPDNSDKISYESVKIRNATVLLNPNLDKFFIYKQGDTISDLIFDNIPAVKIGDDDIDVVPVQFSTGSCTDQEGYLRNIYFNADYLSDVCENKNTLDEIVTTVWSDFSNEYGGIYNFKIDYADGDSRILIRDQGWTLNSVKDILKNENLSTNEKTDGKFTNINKLFTFPVWEKNSMVKSQNLSAKLPKRMQLAAMYGSNKPNTVKDESGNDFDEMAALAWGKLFRPTEGDIKGGETLKERQNKQFKDLISGDISLPTERNLTFGRADADPNEPLILGARDGDGNLILEFNPEGTIVYPSILNEIRIEQKKEAQRRFKTTVENLDGSTEEKDSEDVAYRWNSYLMNTSNNLSFRAVYDIVKSEFGGFTVKMKPEIAQLMIAELKGPSGINGKTDPILPVELELEIDGMGGIFPGNAFQSSYLTSRYKEMACFQVVGVNHKIDLTGWTTSLKGQIRVSIEKEIEKEITALGEKYSQEGPLTGEVDDQAHEDAVSENFDSEESKKADSNLKLSDIGGSKALKIREVDSDLMSGVEEAKPKPSNLKEMTEQEALDYINTVYGPMPEPERPDIPIETEDEDMDFEDLEIEELELEHYEPWDDPPLPPPERPDIPIESEVEDISDDLEMEELEFEHFEPWPDPPPPPENPNPDPQYVEVVNNNNPDVYWSDSSNRVIEVINPGTPLHLQNTLSDGITTDVPNNETISSIASTFQSAVDAINYAEGAENVKGNDLSSQWFANMYAMGYSDIKIASTLDDNGNLIYGLNCNIGARPPLVGDVNVYITGTDDSNYNAYISDTGGNSWNVGNTNE